VPRTRHRLQLGVRGLLIIVAVLAIPSWFLRLILNPWVTVHTTLEIVYHPSRPDPDRAGCWTEAEAILQSPDVIAEALADRPAAQSREATEAAIQRLMLSHGQEADTNLPIVLQMRSSISRSRDDREFLDGVVGAFARRYGRGKVIQNYPARAMKGPQYGEADWVGMILSCLAVTCVLFAVLKRGRSSVRPPI